MSKPQKYYPEKWRPTLSMIVVAMLIFVLALPIGGIWLFRFYDNQLVQETESELIMQGAFIEAMMRIRLERQNFDVSVLPVNSLPKNPKSIALTRPQLDLSVETVLPRRQEARTSLRKPNPDLQKISTELSNIIKIAQETTLAGYRILDPYGTVIMGRSEVGQSLGHIPEVQQALRGEYSSVIRERRSKNPSPPIYSISRGTNIRVFVAMPINYEGKVAGVAYLSRTPSHFLRELYGQIWKILGAVGFISLITLAIAALFVRTIKGPIDALNDRTKQIAKGDRTALRPLERHGTREIANLSQGLLSMSEKLQDRTDYIRTFANHVSHELKSPLTSIQGAAELLRDSADNIEHEKRERFLNNIMSDTNRLSKLLDRLRELAAVEQQETKGTTTLASALNAVSPPHPDIAIETVGNMDKTVALSQESLSIIFSNLLENALKHDATKIAVICKDQSEFVYVTVRDNGSGISPANREKIFNLFFTTRRDSGGTGMGLSIIQSVLATHGGSIELLESDEGTCFGVSLPRVDQRL